jgi:predicted ArsR family transcriptional regulator
VPDDDLEGRLHVLKELLDEQGFMPEIERTDDRTVVRECNCPFPEAVKNTRLPCHLEAQFYETIFDTPLERVSYIPDGNPSCTYVVPDDETSSSTPVQE